MPQHKIAPCDGRFFLCLMLHKANRTQRQVENDSTFWHWSIFRIWRFRHLLPTNLSAVYRRSHTIRSLFGCLFVTESLCLFEILGNKEHLFQTTFMNFSAPDKCLPYLKHWWNVAVLFFRLGGLVALHNRQMTGESVGLFELKRNLTVKEFEFLNVCFGVWVGDGRICFYLFF